jgi:hypothetical protein
MLASTAMETATTRPHTAAAPLARNRNCVTRPPAAAALGCRRPASAFAPSHQRPRRRPSVAAAATPSDNKNQFDIDNAPPPAPLDDPEAAAAGLGPRDDDALPDSLADAVEDAAAATAAAIARGVTRCQVEIMLPEFWDPISGPQFPNRGDQERFWRMTRRFVETLGEKVAEIPGSELREVLAAAGANEGGATTAAASAAKKADEADEADQAAAAVVKAIYPDAGVAAMLSNQWPDRAFAISSLNSRRPVAAEDALVVVACPDPPGAEDCLRTVRLTSEQDEQAGVPERPLVLFNQRLSSGDVGLGLNARRLRSNFLARFTTTYSLRPIGDVGSVFRRYPDQWKVFVEEPGMPGRYFVAATTPSRPAGDALDAIVAKALGADGTGDQEGGDGGGGAAGVLGNLTRTMASVQRFMRSLSS